MNNKNKSLYGPLQDQDRPKPPERLKEMNLDGCKILQELPEWPERLKEMNLGGCKILNELKNDGKPSGHKP